MRTLSFVMMTLALPVGTSPANITGQAKSESVRTSPSSLASDVRVGWLKKNAVGIRTIAPDDRDFNDLRPLKKLIGEARIVMLGESSHGEGGTALAKSRMVEFLHQEMGFDVLVFEGGLYDMTKVSASLQRGDATVPSLRQGVMAAWSGSEQSQKVFDYVVASARTKHPIELAGFDAAVTGTASAGSLMISTSVSTSRWANAFPTNWAKTSTP